MGAGTGSKDVLREAGRAEARDTGSCDPEDIPRLSRERWARDRTHPEFEVSGRSSSTARRASGNCRR